MINSKKKYTIIFIVISIIVICLIFFMSSDVGSNGKTMGLSELVYHALPEGAAEFLTAGGIGVKGVNFIIRKSSHFFEYMILGILLLKVGDSFGVKRKSSVIYVLFTCLLIANLDEFYQSFVDGRTSLVSDCLIDFMGSLSGVLLSLGVSKLYRSRESRKLREER